MSSKKLVYLNGNTKVLHGCFLYNKIKCTALKLSILSLYIALIKSFHYIGLLTSFYNRCTMKAESFENGIILFLYAVLVLFSNYGIVVQRTTFTYRKSTNKFQGSIYSSTEMQSSVVLCN